MCTVTYIPSDNGYILTSNRDESPLRMTRAPSENQINGVRLWSPTDVNTGGTWFGVNEHLRSVCLLNGAFHQHQRKSFYPVSRGKIVLDILTTGNIYSYLDHFDFSPVEPFTLLITESFPSQNIREFRWDGEKMHEKELNPALSHIWSSATLYNEEQSALRKEWFNNWLVKYREHDDFNISMFHRSRHTQDEGINVIMNRNNCVRTVSITGLIIEQNHGSLTYHDLLMDRVSHQSIKRDEQLRDAV